MIIDICILAGRRTENLERFLDSFNKLLVPPNALIIVLDMNNHDCVPKIEIKQNIHLELIQFRGKFRQPQMRNLALEKTNADFIWFMDDDVSLDEDALIKLQTVIEDINGTNVCCIAGKIHEQISYDPSILKMPIQLHWAKGTIGYYAAARSRFTKKYYNFHRGHSGTEYPIIAFPQGTSMVFSVKQFKNIGFNEALGKNYASYEDAEPSFALKYRGLITIYSPDFSLYHHKLLRIDGSDRGSQSILYNYYLVRNHTLSLIKNRYPSFLKSILYSISFSVVQFLRFQTTPNTKIWYRLISPLIFFIAFWDGLFSISRTRK